MKKKSNWILALVVALGGMVFFSTGNSQACSITHHKFKPARYHDKRVNTTIEARYDLNRNGFIGYRERYAMNHRYVNTWKERRCDSNHNGLVDPREISCIY